MSFLYSIIAYYKTTDFMIKILTKYVKQIALQKSLYRNNNE